MPGMSHLHSHPAPLRLAACALVIVAVAASLAAVAGCGAKQQSADSGSSPAPAASAPAADTAAAPAAPASTPAAGQSAGADVGGRVFKTRCVVCHGASGHGDGIASKGLDPKPRNFHDKAYMATKTDAQLLATIHAGKGAMPSWKSQLSEDEMKAVLAYVRTFASNP